MADGHRAHLHLRLAKKIALRRKWLVTASRMILCLVDLRYGAGHT